MNKLPTPENRSFFHDEMFKVHSHAEMEFDQDPGKVVYTEENVLAVMRLVRDKTLEWAAENAEWNGNWEYPNISMDSILAGKTHKDLEI